MSKQKKRGKRVEYKEKKVKRREKKKDIKDYSGTSSFPTLLPSHHFLLARSWCLCLGLSLLSLLGGLRLANKLGTLTEDKLDVRGVGHVSGDATVGTIHTTTHLRSTLSSDVIDEKTVQVKLLALGVGLSVLDERQQDLAALLGPATLSAAVPLMALSLAANLAIEATERNDLLLLKNVVEVLLGADESHTLNSGTNLTHVLEVSAHVDSASPRNHANVLGEVRIVVCHLHKQQNKNKIK